VASQGAALGGAGGQPAAAGEKVKEAVMMIDLDKCAIFGNDGNDLGIALQVPPPPPPPFDRARLIGPA